MMYLPSNLFITDHNQPDETRECQRKRDQVQIFSHFPHCSALLLTSSSSSSPNWILSLSISQLFYFMQIVWLSSAYHCTLSRAFVFQRKNPQDPRFAKHLPLFFSISSKRHKIQVYFLVLRPSFHFIAQLIQSKTSCASAGFTATAHPSHNGSLSWPFVIR
jgi:hypothetical protein